MPETVKIGNVKVPKNVLYIGGVAGAAVVAYAYLFRRDTVSADSTASEEPLIDPYTGLPYVDEFGMGYSGLGIYDPASGYTIGGGYGNQIVTGNTTNATWSQAAISYLVLQGYEGSVVASALGKVLTGIPVTNDELNIFNAARATQGEPPQPYPPIQMVGSSGPPPDPTGAKGSELPAVNDLHVQQLGSTFIIIDWTDAGNLKNAKGYHLYLAEGNGQLQRWRGLHPPYSLASYSNLKPRTTYRLMIRGVGVDNVEGPPSNTVTVKTK